MCFFFFENKDGALVAVNGDTYRTMITDIFIATLYAVDVNDIWFQ